MVNKRTGAALLDGYADILSDVCRTGRRLAHHELAARRAIGAQAARSGVPLSTVVDRYLAATRRSWSAVPGSGPDTHKLAASVLRAANDAIVAVTEGYGDAQRAAIRAEENTRREFIDDLLHGGEPGRLAERAGRFGLQLTETHLVAVVGGPDARIDPDGPIAETARRRLGDGGRTVLVTTKDDLLVCIAPGADAERLTDRLQTAVDGEPGVGLGIGRPHAGPGGVARSYADARTALELSHRLGLPARQMRSADLLVYQVLGRDRAAMVDLVATVLRPLRGQRGGPQPLLDTLTAYFASGSAAGAARDLHLSVRALTYRLARVHRLTGYDPTDPVQRYTLETAVLGARMLNWPTEPLPIHA